MTEGLAATTPQNQVVDGLNQFTQALTSIGQGAANIYSSFIGARTTYELAKTQQTSAARTPTYSPGNTVNALMQNKGVAFGLVFATLATGYLVYKAVK